MKALPYFEINPSVLTQLKEHKSIGITKYLILDYIFRKSQKQLNETENPNYITQFVPIVATDFQKLFGADNSVISRHLKDFVDANILINEPFGYALSDPIQKIFIQGLEANSKENLVLSYRYYRYVDTPEKAIITHFLIEHFYNQKNEFNLVKVLEKLPFSKNTITNLISNNPHIKQEGNKITFSKLLYIEHLEAKSDSLKFSISNLPFQYDNNLWV